MKVVIAGAGFAGLQLARRLSNKDGVEVLLLDRFNFHQFQPLFYQVATAALDASNISFPLRNAFHNSRNVRVRMETLKEIVPAQNKLITDMGEIGYDVLVLATGADTNFFGNRNLIENAMPMKSTVEAIRIRHQLIQNFEDAVHARDALQLERAMTVVIVGGGPTGVELSGAIADMRNSVLPKDYPELDFARMKIYLLEGLPKTLPVMSQKSSDQSRRYLEKLGVIVLTGTAVSDYDGDTVLLQNGQTIPTSLVIWAAGVKGNVPAGVKPDLIVRGNRLKVDPFNRVQGTGNIFAVGDLAYMELPAYPKGHPQLASVAMQQGRTLAANLQRLASGNQELTEFRYRDKGSMATVGRNLAVVDLPRLHFGGFAAWLVWMGLHLFLLLGMKNRIFVFMNWLYQYVTRKPSIRLLFKEFCKQPKKVESIDKKPVAEAHV